MKYNLEILLKMDKKELETKLKDTYQKQKLSPKMHLIARILDISLSLFIIIFIDDILYQVLLGLFLCVSFYRLIKPHSEDNEILKNLELVTEYFENYKICKLNNNNNGLSEKKIKQLEKTIGGMLPAFLSTNFMFKVFAFIPLLNLNTDEMHIYSGKKSALHMLLYGGLGVNGLDKFSPENLNN